MARLLSANSTENERTTGMWASVMRMGKMLVPRLYLLAMHWIAHDTLVVATVIWKHPQQNLD